MIKKIFLVFVLIGIYPIIMNSQELKYSDYENSFGLKASNMTGYGFFYNRVINEDMQIQLMGLIYYFLNKEAPNEHSIFDYDIGAELQFNIYKTQKSRLYLLTGGYYYFDDDIKLVDEKENLKVETNSYNIGVGVAWEFYYKRFIFGFDLGYKFFADNKVVSDSRKNKFSQYPEEDRVTKIGAGVSLGITF